MADFAADEIVRQGTAYWTIEVDGFGEEQNKLAKAYNGGQWTLAVVDSSTGGSRYVDWVAGEKAYDNLEITYLMNNTSGKIGKLAKDFAEGTGDYKKRFNVTAKLLTSSKKNVMEIHWLNCQLVEHRLGGFSSTNQDAATEIAVFRPERCEIP